jgi:hypothetical protein
MTKDDAETDAARDKRRNMGLYVATLVARHSLVLCPKERQITNKLCLSIDIQHGEMFPAPGSNTRRMNDLEAACRTIAALWMTA